MKARAKLQISHKRCITTKQIRLILFRPTLGERTIKTLKIFQHLCLLGQNQLELGPMHWPMLRRKRDLST